MMGEWLDYLWEDEDNYEEEIYCDYGCAEFCIDPFLRNCNCCFECEAYLDSILEEEGYYNFALFWRRAEWDLNLARAIAESISNTDKEK